jgi:hypothetical protein
VGIPDYGAITTAVARFLAQNIAPGRLCSSREIADETAQSLFLVEHILKQLEGSSLIKRDGNKGDLYVHSVSPDLRRKFEGHSAGPADQLIANCENAFDTFRAANETFTNLFKNAVAGERTITTDDLAAYTTPVEGLLSAALKLEEQFQFASTTAREKYHEALQGMETSWKTFASVDDGQMNGDAYVPFLDEVAAFMKARNDYVLGA